MSCVTSSPGRQCDEPGGILESVAGGQMSTVNGWVEQNDPGLGGERLFRR
jgi:hypothetical protein